MATFNFDTEKLKASLQQSLQDVLNQEKQLSSQDLSNLATFSAQIFPLLTQQVQEMVTSSNPQVQQTYIDGLLAAEVDRAAQLLGTEIVAQRTLLIQQAKSWVINFASAIISATTNPLLGTLLGAVVQGATAGL